MLHILVYKLEILTLFVYKLDLATLGWLLSYLIFFKYQKMIVFTVLKCKLTPEDPDLERRGVMQKICP